MGSYIYSSVQNAIGGNTAASGFQKNWSPNRIRALYIMRSFILVVDYLVGPKLIPLNQDEVGKDLQNINRVGSLNNLLSSRQLSCLEEIYADEVFARFPNTLDLKAYADSVVNSASRLRYYAYTVIADGQALAVKYREAFAQGVVDFTYAQNIGGIRVVDTGNSDWYKKYNLRPQYYGPDIENGSLAVWFRKVEKAVESVAKTQMAEKAIINSRDFIRSRIEADLVHTRDLSMVLRIMEFGKNATDSYGLRKAFYEAALKGMRCKTPIPGLSQSLIVDVARAIDGSSEFASYMQKLCSVYRMCDLYMSQVTFDVRKLSPDLVNATADGFLQFGDLLDRMLASVYEALSTNSMYKYTIFMALQTAFPSGVPEGALALRLKGKVTVRSGKPQNFVGEYLCAFYEIMGVSREFLMSIA